MMHYNYFPVSLSAVEDIDFFFSSTPMPQFSGYPERGGVLFRGEDDFTEEVDGSGGRRHTGTGTSFACAPGTTSISTHHSWRWWTFDP